MSVWTWFTRSTPGTLSDISVTACHLDRNLDLDPVWNREAWFILWHTLSGLPAVGVSGLSVWVEKMREVLNYFKKWMTALWKVDDWISQRGFFSDYRPVNLYYTPRVRDLSMDLSVQRKQEQWPLCSSSLLIASCCKLCSSYWVTGFQTCCLLRTWSWIKLVIMLFPK